MLHAEVVAVIPAYEPDDELLRLVEALHGKLPLIVVDDGSKDARVIERLPADVTVLAHEHNQGKGAALKTAFRHALAHCPNIVGVVTVDADGQHLPEDALKVAQCLREHPSAMVFGVRRFGREVPLRNRFGNVLTNYVVDAFLNIRLSDTQTGLRGIPKKLLTVGLALPFNRYEFEAEMLVRAKGLGVAFKEVAIRTVYSPSATVRSRFSPIVDSMRIYWVLFRHALAGLCAALVDFSVYLVVLLLSGHVLASVYAGRASSLLVNFRLLGRFVFRSRNRDRIELLLYLLQVAATALATALLVDLARDAFDIHPAVSKVPVDVLLYPLSFFIQRRFIFR